MAGERILVVDDAPDILEALVITLNDSGFETLGASDGRTALRAFYEFQPQLVVLDLVMPMMSGVEVCRQVRAMSDGPQGAGEAAGGPATVYPQDRANEARRRRLLPGRICRQGARP